MTALVLRALKTLPEEYVRDGTQTMQHRDAVLAINPALPPILWLESEGWKPLKLAPAEYQPIHLSRRPVIQEV